MVMSSTVMAGMSGWSLCWMPAPAAPRCRDDSCTRNYPRQGRGLGQTAGETMKGDAGVLARLAAVLEAPDPDFAIVTP
jgi:hypothetical protein